MIKIPINLSINKEDIDTIMWSGISGISYWCASIKVKDNDMKGQEKLYQVISNNGTLLIEDGEDSSNKEYELNLESTIKGISLYIENMINNERTSYHSIIDIFDNIDEHIANEIIQYAIFGEILYC